MPPHKSPRCDYLNVSGYCLMVLERQRHAHWRCLALSTEAGRWGFAFTFLLLTSGVLDLFFVSLSEFPMNIFRLKTKISLQMF